MGKLKKGICCLLSALMMVSVCLMTRPQDIRADISESVWQNYNGEIVFYDEPSECFIYQTMDVKKTSSVFYRTIGIEFSRIKKDVDPTDGLHGGSHFYVGESDGHGCRYAPCQPEMVLRWKTARIHHCSAEPV